MLTQNYDRSAMPAMINCILFDLDGTLVDTWRLYLESYRHGLGEFFSTPPSDREIADLRPASEIRLFRRVAGEGRFRECLEKFYAHYESRHDEFFDGAYPGVADMLTGLRAAGCRTGIITGKSRRAWEITSSRCRLGAFDAVITDDDVDELKPHPEGILKALSELESGPENAMYIGDSYNDSKAAAAAGMVFGATLWSKEASEIEGFVSRIRKYGEHILLQDPRDVVRIIGREQNITPLASGNKGSIV